MSGRDKRKASEKVIRQSPARRRYVSETIYSNYLKRLSIIISITLLILVVAFGIYLRILPLVNSHFYGYPTFLDELDPYSNYYVVKYLLDHGLLSFWDLKPPNPAAEIFWYPWGRDFTKTDVPGIYYTIYFLYLPFSRYIDLMTFMAYMPVIAAAISLIGVYLVSREISGSEIASVIITGLVATFFMDRTVAGFMVKYTIAIMITPWIFYIFIKAFKTNKTLYYMITGLLLAYSAYSTGLFAASYVPIYATLLLAPFVMKREDLRKLLINTVLMSIPVLIVFVSTPIYGYIYVVKNLGLVPIAVIFMLTIYDYVYISYLKKRALLTYVGTLIGVVVVGVILLQTGFLGIAGKAAQALGFYHVLGTLSFTIAEYQPTNMGYVLNIYGSVFILSIFSVIYNLYLTFYRKDLVAFFISIQGLIMLYVLTNLSYFLSLAVISMALTASSFLGLLVRHSSTMFIKLRRYFSFSSLLAVILLISILLSHVYIVYSYHIPAYRTHLPMIVTSGISVSIPSDAWIQALKWIRNNTDPDSVIVAWWDYGYWISVLGRRASVADGSTINGTQIELLAKFFTATNESDAIKILREDLRLKPNKTYILVYDVFTVNRYGEYIVPLNWADAAKGISAIYRIAGVNIDYDIYGNNTPSYYTVGSGPQRYVKVYRMPDGSIRIAPNWASDYVRNTTLYGIMIDGALHIFKGYTFYSEDPNVGGQPVQPPEFKYLKPAAIFMSYIPIYGNSPNSYFEAYVMVFIYQFVE